ncbi:MAG: rhodanese-like domain-containing protein [Verrucomicrobia bacterium]|nr:rhodanese-like domain-containing protein [Verrucomicrobiota bacterium]
MKTIYVFPALVITAAIFSGACQKNDQKPAPKKGSSPSSSAAIVAPTTADNAPPETKADKKTSSETKIEHASAVQAAELMKKDPAIVVLDVRAPSEFGNGHIKGAINVDFRAASFADDLKDLDRSKTYLVHCQAGGRSTSALDTFKKLGFKHIIHLDGGMMDWGKEQLPVEK